MGQYRLAKAKQDLKPDWVKQWKVFYQIDMKAIPTTWQLNKLQHMYAWGPQYIGLGIFYLLGLGLIYAGAMLKQCCYGSKEPSVHNKTAN